MPPAALAEHLKDGFPDPDDIGWMRGLFPGATDKERAEWNAIQDWVKACTDTGTARVRAEIIAMGQGAPSLGDRTYPPPLCAAVADLPPPKGMAKDWNAYLTAHQEAGRAFAIFFHGAKLGFESAPFDPAWANEDARMLMHATVREQVYRKAMSWPVDGPKLEPAVWQAFRRRLTLAVTQEDAKNTAMLETYVAEHGWPTISRVGQRASGAAWLLVQHADLDPAFQLKALRLMEPLVSKGEVSKSDYAYLYDRVMLKIAGTQRYGTQMTCKDGELVPEPLEAGVEVDAARAEMGLNPIADYQKMMDEGFAPCPTN
ncbi:hypothetical protein D1610_09700 [Sphingomonas gilva]|uniref:Uncharacterized protein n=1 Tax=Sphingomonas gilva TaxID=2305907 RepID=A0A396RVJ9_9SPHN|nr:hypothetical protein D1610_09700 [Sphingomonas gilva]